jgi:hypothetical protein
MKETYGKAFQKIFSYYLDLATKRRNQVIATEQMLLRDMRVLRPEDILLLQDAKRQELHNLKEYMKLQKDFIGYKEYMQVRSSIFLLYLCSSNITYCVVLS